MAEKQGKTWWERVREQAGGLRGGFSRERSFQRMLQFMELVLMRRDYLGISSLVRASGKKGKESDSLYHALLGLFRSKAWTPTGLMKLWRARQTQSPHLLRIGGRAVIVGDHTHAIKEGCRMAGVRNLHQNSETSSKPDIARGQTWGCLAVIKQEEQTKTTFATPVMMELHRFDGSLSMTERPVAEAVAIAEESGEAMQLVFDAAACTGPAFKIARASNGKLELTTRAAKNAVAFREPEARQPGQRGRSKVYGDKVKLIDQFKERDAFVVETVDGVEIRHRKLILFSPMLSTSRKKTPSAKEKKARKAAAKASGVKPKRGRPRKDAAMQGTTAKPQEMAQPQDLRLAYFCISSPRGDIVLVSTDLSMSAADAHRLYKSRPVIENFFRVFKHVLHGFDSHFWSGAIAKASRRTGADANDKLDARFKSPLAQDALKAIEGHAVLMSILCGMLQELSLTCGEEILKDSSLWMRSQGQSPSEFLIAMIIQAQQLKQDPAAA
jgi:hypothetical protein